ncbi:MAG: FAD-binding oxidoreductase [Firmicutes bacterium]|nr:FAD-binding oxidoreductase [Bacillota bacterium]
MAKDKEFQPNWYHKPAPEQSYRSIFRWGYPDQFKHPNKRLYRLMKQTFAMTDADFEMPRDVGEEQVSFDVPINLSEAQLDELRAIVGPENVHIDDYSRLRVAYGKMIYDLVRLRKKIIENLPDAVVAPRHKEDIRALIRWCNEHKIPITPFAGGSSVMRGTECPKGGISLDMRVHMNKIVKLNPENQTVTVQAGMMGPDYEEQLNRAPELFGTKLRYTGGHLPQSFHSAAIGGWIVTRGAGQNSTYYGKIEDLVISQEYVTPVGDIVTKEYPKEAIGPDIDQIMIGSEGAYGILTEATLKIYRYMPENTRRFSYIFRDWQSALNAVREISQGEFGLPSVFRLSDPEETDVGLKLYGVEGTVIDKLMQARGYKQGERCLLLGTADGEAGFSRHIKRMVHKIAKKHGAMSTTGYVTRRWEHGRFMDPYMREDLQDYGVIIDTLECAVPWDRLHEVWKYVRAYCKSRPQTICMSHSSHFYPQGTNLYFIFIARMEPEEYLEYQAGVIDHIRQAGAALSHHHGIGRMLAPWYEDALGKNELELLRAIKRHLDPNNILNPGCTLALDLPEDEKR